MLDIDTLSTGEGRGGVNVYCVCIIISTVVVLAGNARAEAGRAGGAGRRGRVTIPLSGDGLGGGRTWPVWPPADMDKRCLAMLRKHHYTAFFLIQYSKRGHTTTDNGEDKLCLNYR